MAMYHVICHVDVDECSDGTHQCMQNCNNTLGSYVCTCDSGFIIDADARTCDGKHSNHPCILLPGMHVANP